MGGVREQAVKLTVVDFQGMVQEAWMRNRGRHDAQKTESALEDRKVTAVTLDRSSWLNTPDNRQIVGIDPATRL